MAETLHADTVFPCQIFVSYVAIASHTFCTCKDHSYIATQMCMHLLFLSFSTMHTNCEAFFRHSSVSQKSKTSGLQVAFSIRHFTTV